MLNVLTVAMGRTFPATLECLWVISESLTVETGWGVHLTQLMQLLLHPPAWGRLRFGVFAGLTNVRQVYTYGSQQYTHMNEDWWWTGANGTRSGGIPNLMCVRFSHV